MAARKKKITEFEINGRTFPVYLHPDLELSCDVDGTRLTRDSLLDLHRDVERQAKVGEVVWTDTLLLGMAVSYSGWNEFRTAYVELKVGRCLVAEKNGEIWYKPILPIRSGANVSQSSPIPCVLFRTPYSDEAVATLKALVSGMNRFNVELQKRLCEDLKLPGAFALIVQNPDGYLAQEIRKAGYISLAHVDMTEDPT